MTLTPKTLLVEEQRANIGLRVQLEETEQNPAVSMSVPAQTIKTPPAKPVMFDATSSTSQPSPPGLPLCGSHFPASSARNHVSTQETRTGSDFFDLIPSAVDTAVEALLLVPKPSGSEPKEELIARIANQVRFNMVD